MDGSSNYKTRTVCSYVCVPVCMSARVCVCVCVVMCVCRCVCVCVCVRGRAACVCLLNGEFIALSVLQTIESMFQSASTIDVEYITRLKSFITYFSPPWLYDDLPAPQCLQNMNQA